MTAVLLATLVAVGAFPPPLTAQRRSGGLFLAKDNFFALLGFEQPYEDVSVPEAFEMMRKDRTLIYIDVRSQMEYETLVPPKSTINIPAFETSDDWEDDDAEWKWMPDFMDRVLAEERITTDTPLLVGVRAGSRQVQACMALADAGFKQIYNVQAGKFIQSRQTGDNALA